MQTFRWCRAELWCRLLSNKIDTTVIVVYSNVQAEFMYPLDWQSNSIPDEFQQDLGLGLQGFGCR